ncbi:hypothetical protein [Roseimaritima ulvae]|uniref:CARDB domain-containing protein n=1 Tax=Roseimaritima ulvae TaxID=980254 RepID=A0A5B9QKB8_9BACT|nr:hypothetical protein [Roseimaritima ulvae]QEG38439.1 hypothetical protein UC8_03960 [Roseimaritima ulvae]
MRLTSPFLLAAMAFALVACVDAVPAAAQYPASNNVHNVLGSQRSCAHVIDLMLRYGSGGVKNYPATGGLIQPTAFGPALVPHTELGDLQLVSVTAVSDGDATCGPSFAVTVRNDSHRDVCDFHITIVGVLHRIHPWSPTTVHCVEKICAGQTVECQISLPVEALSMGRAGAQVLCFQTLVVAVDSYDQLLECDESNNVSVLTAADLPRAVVTGQSVEVETNTTTAPATENPAGPAAGGTGPQTAQPDQPVDSNPESNLDDLDFDNLDLGEATAAVSRF